jgi:hypothetical protein
MLARDFELFGYWEFPDMKRLYLVALMAGVMTALPARMLYAQQAAPAAETGAPAAAPAAPAPAATPAPAASPSAAAPPASGDKSDKKAAAKKKSGKMTRQQEIDRSIESGTVPSRYRSQVPKEYQQYVPFDRK